MKKQLFTGVICLICLAGCGGNYSNEDVEFINALPVRAELESKLPQGSAKALESTRRDAIAVDQPSQVYLDTKKASDGFNNFLFLLLSLIDDIRKIPPTHRDGDRRIWGPFPSNDYPDVRVQVVIERRETAFYEYRIEQQLKNAPNSAPWVPLIKGQFRATGGARKGSGELHLLAKATRDAGIPTRDLETWDTLDVTYATDRSPLEVDMLIRSVPDPHQVVITLPYSYREYDDRRGAIKFEVQATSPDGTMTWAVTTHWLPAGQGRADILVTAGPFFRLTGIECWDAQFRVKYSNKPWETPSVVGDPASCSL
jgi:hypothetical protein